LFVEAWQDWIARARGSAIFQEDALSEQLNGYVTEWLLVTT